MRFFPLVDLVDAVLKMGQWFNVDFVVDSVGKLALVVWLAVDCFETDVLNCIANNLQET